MVNRARVGYHKYTHKHTYIYTLKIQYFPLHFTEGLWGILHATLLPLQK